ncbi:MAG: NAD(P)H-dependent oxidoreductase [Hyphomicrobiaceae bacterium]
MARINILFHTVSGHTFKLAESLAEGVREIPRCDVKLLRIPEPHGMPPIVMPGLEARHYDFAHIPEATIDDLADCDGLALGSPVYWGGMSYATKLFLDSAARLWDLGSPNQPVRSAPDLAAKPATAFTGGGSGLGNDPALLGMWTALGFFGMTIVTLGIAVPEVSEPTRVDGGSPLGAQTFGRRPGKHPSPIEATIARKQGRRLAEVTRAWAERSRA